MEKYIGDDKVILLLQGLRFIIKEDRRYGLSTKVEYFLKWDYKGAEGSLIYEDKAERDALYNRVLAELTKPKPQSKP